MWTFIIWIPAVLCALALHEAAHAYAADYLGDPTPRRLGRVTLNPLAHLDVIGTLLLVLVHIGWGKPVPVDPRNFNRPRRDMVLVALAGPLANIVTAVILAFVLRTGGFAAMPAASIAINALVIVSLLLALFNLLPLPPLDGSKILYGLLPVALSPLYLRISKPLSWSLLALVVIGSASDFNPLGTLLFQPVDILYEWMVGRASSI